VQEEEQGEEGEEREEQGNCAHSQATHRLLIIRKLLLNCNENQQKRVTFVSKNCEPEEVINETESDQSRRANNQTIQEEPEERASQIDFEFNLIVFESATNDSN
jgi:hypothetical protein